MAHRGSDLTALVEVSNATERAQTKSIRAALDASLQVSTKEYCMRCDAMRCETRCKHDAVFCFVNVTIYMVCAIFLILPRTLATSCYGGGLCPSSLRPRVPIDNVSSGAPCDSQGKDSGAKAVPSRDTNISRRGGAAVSGSGMQRVTLLPGRNGIRSGEGHSHSGADVVPNGHAGDSRAAHVGRIGATGAVAVGGSASSAAGALTEPFVAWCVSRDIDPLAGLFLSASMSCRDVESFADSGVEQDDRRREDDPHGGRGRGMAEKVDGGVGVEGKRRRARPEDGGDNCGEGARLRRGNISSSCCRARLCRVASNRGASGIDGVVSSAMGYATGLGAPVTLVIGDMATLHDVGSMHALQGLDASQCPVTVVCVNNGGKWMLHQYEYSV